MEWPWKTGILRAIIEDRMIRRVNQQVSAPSVPSTGDEKKDPYWEASGRVLEAAGISTKDHVIMQENVARYFSQLDPKFLQLLKETRNEELAWVATHRCYVYGKLRWGRKLTRDLEAPYTDRQVIEHLGELEKKFTHQIEEIVANQRPFPMKIFITGSLAKGYFGGNSDIDGVVALGGDLKGPQSHGDGDLSLQYLPLSDEAGYTAEVEKYGKNVELDSSEVFSGKGYLKKVFFNALQGRGIEAAEGPEGSMRLWKTQRYVIRQKETSGFVDFEDLP